MAPVVSDHIASRQFMPYNVAVIVFMGVASVAMGYSASIIGTTLAQPTFLDYFELTTRPDGTSLISTMNGLFQAGAFVGACLINPVADHWGRKWAITLPALLVMLSGALLAGSVNIAMFLVFRFVAGVGSWMLLGTIPIWMTEVAPPKNRGALVNIHGTCLLFGYACACWVGYGFYFVDHPGAWRATFAFQCLPAVIVSMGMPLLPESPRYLVKSGKLNKARTVLARLHAHQEARIEFAQIEAQLRVDALLPNTWKSLVVKKSYRKRTLFAIGLACGIQFTGVLVINNYSSIIYGGLGISGSTVLLYTSAFNTLGFGCGIIGIFLIDLLPRNKLVALGTTLVTTCLVVEAALVAKYPVGPDQNKAALQAAVAMTFCYMAFSQLCLDEVQWVWYPELFPNHLRGKGVTIGLAAVALMNIMWLQAAPSAFENIGWKFYLCFIIPAYLFAVVCFLFFPDTRGMALEEIGALFGDESEIYRVPNEELQTQFSDPKTEHTRKETV